MNNIDYFVSTLDRALTVPNLRGVANGLAEADRSFGLIVGAD